MKLAFRITGVVAIVATTASVGCGRRSVQPPQAMPLKATTPLPNWQPRHPSPEFTRAAKVLKPLPDELLQGALAKSTEGEAVLQRYRATLSAGYEFFGTLNDHQIERLQTNHEIRISSKSLTPRQRAALEHWFENWRVAMRGTGPIEDFLVSLYRIGAREDLSNVDVGFTAVRRGGDSMVAGHLVQIYFWVTQPGGKVVDLGTVIAQI